METLDILGARRLALARAGLLKPEWTGMPSRAAGSGKRAREAAHRVIRRFGYLQLDTVSIAGARSHSIVLHSRLDGFDPSLGEELLQAGEPLFEYWGHEASWIPMELYPVFAFRRKDFSVHPWWGDLCSEHPKVAREVRRRIREEGPLRTAELEGQRKGKGGWWDLKTATRVANQLWSSGEFAIWERRNFHRTYDLAERVIPEEWRAARAVPRKEAIEILLLKALDGHGWATKTTLAQTWRFRNMAGEVHAALARLEEKGQIAPCELVGPKGARTAGWIRPADLNLAARLRKARPQGDRGVLLSPFDPLLWDRPRVKALFGFDQVLETYKPAPQRKYGYYCLPVLAGDRLVARFDLKAEKPHRLRVLSCRLEAGGQAAGAEDQEAARTALVRYAEALGLKVTDWK